MKSLLITPLASLASFSMQSRVQFSLRDERGRFDSCSVASSSTHSAPRFAAGVEATPEGFGGGGGGAISASEMVWAPLYAATLAWYMSRRLSQPPTGVPAESSGLAEPVERPVHEGSCSREHSCPTTRPVAQQIQFFSRSSEAYWHCGPKHTCTSPLTSSEKVGFPVKMLRVGFSKSASASAPSEKTSSPVLRSRSTAASSASRNSSSAETSAIARPSRLPTPSHAFPHAFPPHAPFDF